MTEQKMLVLQVDLSEDESKIQQYIDYHADVWPDVIEDLKKRPIGRMRIYNSGNRLIMLLEVDKDFKLEDGIHIEPPHPKVAEWSKLMTSFSKKLDSGNIDEWTPIDQVFDTEDYCSSRK